MPASGSVFLCGLSGSGKSTVAPLLARLRNAESFDTDRSVVDEAGMSIAEIFAREGEAGFRSREARAVARACARRDCVVALGGGALEDAETRAHVNASGTLVFLDAPADVLIARVRESREVRPLLAQPGALEAMRQRRLPLFASAALTIVCGTRPPDAIAREIDRALRALESPA